MKKRYIVAGAVLTLALMTGAAAFAQTSATVGQGATATAVTVPTSGVPTQAIGITPGQDGTVQRGMMGRTGGYNNGGNFYGRGGSAEPAFNYSTARSSRAVTLMVVGRSIAMVITMVLVWIIMLLIIGLLSFKLKKIKMMCKEYREEEKK